MRKVPASFHAAAAVTSFLSGPFRVLAFGPGLIVCDWFVFFLFFKFLYLNFQLLYPLKKKTKNLMRKPLKNNIKYFVYNLVFYNV